MIYKVVYLFLYLQIVHKRHFWVFTKLRFIVLICSDLADVIFQVYFANCPDYLTGTVRLNLHIYGRPSTILILTCLFQTSPVSGHTFWPRNRTRTVIQQRLGLFTPFDLLPPPQNKTRNGQGRSDKASNEIQYFRESPEYFSCVQRFYGGGQLLVEGLITKQLESAHRTVRPRKLQLVVARVGEETTVRLAKLERRCIG